MNRILVFFFFLLLFIISCKEEKPKPITSSEAIELDSIVAEEIGDTSNYTNNQ